MDQAVMLSIFKDAIMVAMKLAGPLLLISILIGLVVSIFQAATQIHEQTLTFVPKLLGIALCLLLMGPWMMRILSDFTLELFGMLSNIRV